MAVCGVLFNFAFIPIWQDKAAAVSQLVSIIIYTMVLIIYTKRVNNLKLNYFDLLAPFVLAFTTSIMLNGIKSNALFFTIKVAVVLLFGLFYVLKFKLHKIKWNI